MPEGSGRAFSFVHAADLHLDTPFHGVHEVAPKIATALREASLDAFDAIVDLALARGAAFLLVAGDVYDGAERGLRAQLRFRDGLARLSDAGISSFVVHGNHDPLQTGWSAIGAWPERVTVFGSSAVQVVPVVRDGEQLATVQGISYATTATRENLALSFSRPSGPGLHIGLLHCNVQGVATGYADYSPCTLDDLRGTGLDYLALGHIHQRRILSGRPGTREPFVVYPGNSQARSPRLSEREPKGAVVVEVRGGVIEAVEFAPCDRVRFVEIACAIDELGDLGELEDRLIEQAKDQLRGAEGRSLIARVRLSGRGGLHHDLARPGIVEDLLARLREISGESDPFCWWDAVIDESMIELDLAELVGRGDFSGDLIGLAQAIGRDHEARRALTAAVITEAPRSLQRHLDVLSRDDARLEDLVSQALMLALSELAADQA